jgi:hypothetical protein
VSGAEYLVYSGHNYLSYCAFATPADDSLGRNDCSTIVESAACITIVLNQCPSAICMTLQGRLHLSHYTSSGRVQVHLGVQPSRVTRAVRKTWDNTSGASCSKKSSKISMNSFVSVQTSVLAVPCGARKFSVRWQARILAQACNDDRYI